MCGLFGFVYTGKQQQEDNKKKFPSSSYSYVAKPNYTTLIKELAIASMVRGTDATGIAYALDGKVHVDKAPQNAVAFNVSFPDNTRTVMGHTRKTTQGNFKDNFNNHPFKGRAGETLFALAHNGVIWNDYELQRTWKLPKSKIITDSYVAVQMLEKFPALSESALQAVGESLEGMFTLTMVDDKQNLIIVKNDSPLVIARIDKLDLFVYASTEEILFNALMRWSTSRSMIVDSFFDQQLYISMIQPKAGDILTISPEGDMTWSRFQPTERYSYYSGYGSYGSIYGSSFGTTQTRKDKKSKKKQWKANQLTPTSVIPALTTTAGAGESSLPFALQERLNGVGGGLNGGNLTGSSMTIDEQPIDGDDYDPGFDWDELCELAEYDYGVSRAEMGYLLDYGFTMAQIECAMEENRIWDMVSEVDDFIKRASKYPRLKDLDDEHILTTDTTDTIDAEKASVTAE